MQVSNLLMSPPRSPGTGNTIMLDVNQSQVCARNSLSHASRDAPKLPQAFLEGSRGCDSYLHNLHNTSFISPPYHLFFMLPSHTHAPRFRQHLASSLHFLRGLSSPLPFSHSASPPISPQSLTHAKHSCCSTGHYASLFFSWQVGFQPSQLLLLALCITRVSYGQVGGRCERDGVLHRCRWKFKSVALHPQCVDSLFPHLTATRLVSTQERRELGGVDRGSSRYLPHSHSFSPPLPPPHLLHE
ncbi:hypothetical protein E2C01_011954 [Portunus trituberculatus]|uniref:Uncharacterized protein n=1 Tax=Portunus trituberculatus TaxID=210409 RepID=A0A5B7DCN8_PORTR|nr:hypothetical protein [Portunus trituberculatus]